MVTREAVCTALTQPAVAKKKLLRREGVAYTEHVLACQKEADRAVFESNIELASLDGVWLAASLFESRSPPLRAVVVAGATAVPRRFYRAFARACAQTQTVVVTFDYRGICSRVDARVLGVAARLGHV